MGDPLITEAELVASWAGASSLDDDDRAALVLAASLACERHCGRTLGLADRDEVHRPDGRTGAFWLRSRPVASISRIAARKQAVLTVRNTDVSIPAADVSLTTTGDITFPTIVGLRLRHYAAGATVSNTLTFATYPTVATLAAAINLIGNGWTSEVASGYSGWATADLARDLGAKGALAPGFAEIRAFVELLDPLETDPWSGLVRVPRRSLPPEVRVTYTAGWATADVPSDLKRACISVAKSLSAGALKGAFRREKLGDREYELADAASLAMPPTAASLLASYRERRAL